MKNEISKDLVHKRMSRVELTERLSRLQTSPPAGERRSQREAEFVALLHELEVSQIELEIQNRELVESRQLVDESHDRYVDLFDFAPVGYVTFDKIGSIKEINLTAAEVLHTERHYLIGRPLAAKIVQSERQRFRDYLVSCAQSEKKANAEFCVIGKNGTLIPVQMMTSVARDRLTGETIFRSTITDLTEQKRTEEELKREKARAEQANQTKSAFLANMSHEIRTPLAAILGFTEMMKDCECRDQRTAYANVVSRNGIALTKLIDDILDLTKVEAGRLQVERVDFNVRHLVKEIAVLFQTPIESKNLKLDVEVDHRTPKIINSDPTRIRQILVNLIGNSTKFTDKGKISVRVEPVFDQGMVACISFTVKDTGIGMTKEQMEKLFKPFSQADDSTTRKFGGSGLGLALSRKLAHALGGEIRIKECAPGKGCTFIASVEAKEVAASVESRDSREVPAEARPHSRMNSHILLVEDSVDNQMLVKLLLLKAGMTVDVASNGAEAIRMAESRDYDVVLMDMQMPVLDGYAATERLRSDGYDRPIVALTAHAMVEDRQRTLEIGCDAHLTKPLDSELLVDTISRLQMRSSSLH